MTFVTRHAVRPHVPYLSLARVVPQGALQKSSRQLTIRCILYETAHRGRNSDRRKTMAYVIAEPCHGCKDTACVEVCPCDCIHEGTLEEGGKTYDMLFIDP